MEKVKYFLIFILVWSINLKTQSIEEELNSYINSLSKPDSVQQFESAFHFTPVNQDTTSSCWSFATLSFIESEMNRLHGKSVKLAMMFPVYYGFIEKVKLYISTKGSSHFSPGDLFSGVFDVINKYGIIPLDVYKGDARGCNTFNHDKLYGELYALLKKSKQEDVWDEELILEEAIIILNSHLGTPPQEFSYDGKNYTPVTFRDEVVSLPMNDYVMVTSFLYSPFYEKIKLNVPDNWTGNSNYLNLPLNDFYDELISAVDNGFSAAVDADISEPAYNLNKEYCVIPPFDIASENINQSAREHRFNQGATTDDHLMHIIGHKKINGKDWFLVKDSWRTAYETESPKGYMFIDGDYVKLKVLAYIVHKDALKNLTEKVKL